MQIAPVNYLNRTPELDFLVVSRVEPPGRVDRMLVSKELEVFVERHDGDRVRFRLDAAEAEDLMHGLSQLAESGTKHSTNSSDSLVRFDILLSVDSRVIRLHAVELSADEAVAGVLNFANRMLSASAHALHARRQPSV
jgi:hypothetical protein